MIRTLATSLALLVFPAAAAAQDVTGTIIIAHGADSGWNAPVLDIARRIDTGGPVEVSFLMGPATQTTKFQDVVARLVTRGATRVRVVPLLVSSHSGHYRQIQWLAGMDVDLGETMQHHLHMAGHTRPTGGIPITVAPALDDAGEMAATLAARARALAPDLPSRALMIVGHGPNSAEDNAEWMINLRVVADSVARLTKAADVRVGLVRDDAPAHVRAEAVKGVRDLIELQRRATASDVIVLPVLISRGAVSRDKLPADLAGLPIVYGGDPLLPHDAIVRWAERSAKETRTVTIPTAAGPAR